MVPIILTLKTAKVSFCFHLMFTVCNQNCVTNSQESPSVLPSDVKTLSLRPTAVYGIQVARTLLLVLYRGGKSLDVAPCSAFERIDVCRSLGEDSRHRFAV